MITKSYKIFHKDSVLYILLLYTLYIIIHLNFITSATSSKFCNQICAGFKTSLLKNKYENVRRFPLSAIRGKLLEREKEKKGVPKNCDLM